MTRAKLYPEPEGLDVVGVTCPQCGASDGWACGDDHVSGSHRKRISLALREAKKAELAAKETP